MNVRVRYSGSAAYNRVRGDEESAKVMNECIVLMGVSQLGGADFYGYAGGDPLIPSRVRI